MKKMSKVLLLCVILAVLTACGREATLAGNLAQDITMNTGGSQRDAEKGGDNKEDGEAEQETEVSDCGKQKEEGAFSFVYEGVTLTPGEFFDQSALPGYSDVAEVPSCAFDGNDKVYDYEVFELTAYIEEDGERVYSVYFIDPNMPTTEGLCLGDTVDDMKSLYGEGYEAEGTACTYTRGETLLIIITRNDIVVSIEYRLDR
ncbi:MAG: hypothetical protein K2J60_02600 [Acetatifactor sp.]|nr:hypothetical protein [Acetatifactor sp.]